MRLLRWIHTCCLMIASLSALALGVPDRPLLQHAREAAGVYVVDFKDYGKAELPYTCLYRRKEPDTFNLRHFVGMTYHIKHCIEYEHTENVKVFIFYVEEYQEYIGFPSTCIVPIPARYAAEFEAIVLKMMKYIDTNNDEKLWELLFELALHPCIWIADDAKFALDEIGYSHSVSEKLKLNEQKDDDEIILINIDKFPKRCIIQLKILMQRLEITKQFGFSNASGVLYLALWQRVEGAGIAMARRAQNCISSSQQRYELDCTRAGSISLENRSGIYLAKCVLLNPDSARTGLKEAATVLVDVLDFYSNHSDLFYYWISRKNYPFTPTLLLLTQYLNDPEVSRISPTLQKVDLIYDEKFRDDKREIFLESKQTSADFVAAARRRLAEME